MGWSVNWGNNWGMGGRGVPTIQSIDTRLISRAIPIHNMYADSSSSERPARPPKDLHGPDMWKER